MDSVASLLEGFPQTQGNICVQKQAFLGDKQSFIVLWNISLETVMNTNEPVYFFYTQRNWSTKCSKPEFVIKKRNQVEFIFFTSNW